MTWEDTLPHFSVSEQGSRITAPPLAAPGMFGFVAVLTFLLWIPVSVTGTLLFHGFSEHAEPAVWRATLLTVYLFVPVIMLEITSDEARNRIGQPATAHRVAAIPALGGVGTGLLIAAWWTGMALVPAGVACWAGAGLAALAAWRGVRYTRRRQAWMAALRAGGTRRPGVLRDVTFRRRWAGSRPQFTVEVEYSAASGPQRVTANMTTIASRVPRPGTAVVVICSPHDPAAEVLVELDDADPDFDLDHAAYERPSRS